MSTLAKTYGLQMGVALDPAGPTMGEAFYPLDHPVEKAIIVHAFGGKIVDTPQGKQAAFMSKIYDHYNEVVAMIKAPLEALGYKLYQIGTKDEPPLKGVELLLGRTSMLQCAYLVKRCALLIGNDSMWVHQRGAYGGNVVAVYGPTDVKNHGPEWNDPAKTVLIESHRSGKKPSYQSVENPKTINLITPESIANAALSLLGHPSIARESLSMGVMYNHPVIQLIPDVVMDPRVQTPVPPVIRMDLHFNEEYLAQNLQVRKCQIITNREIDINLLARLKPNIVAIRLEIDNLSPEWIKKVKKLGVQCGIMAVEKDDAKVLKMRLDYYDALLTGFDRYVPPTVEDWRKEVERYTQKPLPPDTKLDTLTFKTNNFILSEGKVYLSKAHWEAKQPAASTDANTGTVIDTPSFWEEFSSTYIYR